MAAVTTAEQLLHGLRSRGEGGGGRVGVQAGARGRGRGQGGNFREVVVRGRDGRGERLLATQRRVTLGALLR